MQLQLQELVESLVARHEADFALLRADLRDAVSEVASRWADRYPVAASMSGHNRCTSVRQTLISMFARRGEFPFASLRASEGPGLSVVLQDGLGTKIRVRKWPTDNLGQRYRSVETPPPGQSTALEQARQQLLDEGLDAPVFPRPMAGPSEVFVLWWADSDEAELRGAELAAVSGIDSGSSVQILAAVPLPQLQPTQTAASASPAPQGDFDEDDESSQAGGTTPA
ncbi:hypothetical protein [Pseudonocardia sp. TRM90224]|uniref:hypothetical protein n=1 Tax=Pseudonocardia sp. TRM90224 TaxID=2812678 RepID=UPI001E5E1326|nr:hypothetical protein [Pseudonocardia sp. TRM90224]